MYQYPLRMATEGLKHDGVFQCEWSGVNIGGVGGREDWSRLHDEELCDIISRQILLE